MKSVSVLMSIYNETEDQIRESVSSVLSQDYINFEVILVLDNPERFDVEKIIKDFNDSRIIFVRNETNIGLAMSMNKAARIAKSDYYIRMDADDICLPGRFKNEMAIIETNNYDFVFSNYDVINEKSEIIRISKGEDDIRDSRHLYNMISLDPSIIHHPTVMYTKNIFNQCGGYRDFPCSQDADLWLRMAEKGCRFYKIGKAFLRYRINSHSITNNRWYQQQLTCHYIFELSVQRLKYGYDSYSMDNYHQYLEKYKVNDENAKKELRNAVTILSESNVARNKGMLFRFLWLRTKVLIISTVYRRHAYFLLVKKKKLNK